MNAKDVVRIHMKTLERIQEENLFIMCVNLMEQDNSIMNEDDIVRSLNGLNPTSIPLYCMLAENIM